MINNADQNALKLKRNSSFTGSFPPLPLSSSTDKEEIQITKSENDKRLYRFTVLTNQLKVLLVSDPETDIAAASLAVKVGSFSDPPEIPGLAHFCEHMILLGSKKHPEESSFANFISSHSGSNNACTTSTDTCFYFTVDPEFIEEALKIFSGLFESPLFTESAIEREVNAVDSEHQRNLSSDPRRINQVDKILSSPEHEYSKFSTGTRATLFDNPRAKSISIRDELIKFHAKYYSSNIMAVTIIAKESLDEMERRYAPLFQNIPNRNISLKCSSTPWTAEYLQKKISIVPVKSGHELRLFWPINDYVKFYKAAPTSYVTHLLGHESAGSLLSELKRRRLANGLFAENIRPGSGFACIMVYVDLTDRGLERVDEIITLVFQYINMISHEGCQKWVFEEDKLYRALRFKFKGKENPYRYVQTLSCRMLIYAPEDILTSSYLISEYREDLIKEVINCLTPENFRYYVISHEVADTCNSTEPYFKTFYGCESIPREKIEAWKNCGFNKALHFPPRNTYMPSDFSLKGEVNPEDENSGSIPRVIQEVPGNILWFKQDSTFKLPYSCICVNLISPTISQDPMHDMLMDLFVILFHDFVNETVYQFTLAGLFVNVPIVPPCLRIIFGGYSQKMPILVSTIMNTLMEFKLPSKERFELFLMKLKLKVQNFTTYPAYKQAERHFQSLLFDGTFPYKDRLAAVEQITYEDLVQFISTVFSRVYVETLVYGNEDMDGAIKYNQMVLDALKKHAKWRPPLVFPYPHLREVEVPAGKGFVLEQVNQANGNSAIYVYYQNQPLTTENCAMHRLFEQLVKQSAYNVLRTEQQLGYIVSAHWRRSNSFQGVVFMIQSKYNPRDLDHYIEEFIACLESKLNKMSNEEFEKHKNSIITELGMKARTMSEECTHYWNQITNRRYDFNANEKEAKFLETVRKEDILAFYETYFKANSKDRRKVAVYVTSKAAPPTEREDYGLIDGDLIEFKRSLPLRQFCASQRQLFKFNQKRMDEH